MLYVDDEKYLSNIYNNKDVKRALKVGLKLNGISLSTYCFIIYDKGNYFTYEFKDVLKRFIIHFNL